VTLSTTLGYKGVQSSVDSGSIVCAYGYHMMMIFYLFLQKQQIAYRYILIWVHLKLTRLGKIQIFSRLLWQLVTGLVQLFSSIFSEQIFTACFSTGICNVNAYEVVDLAMGNFVL
jgi:hypothetical protein